MYHSGMLESFSCLDVLKKTEGVCTYYYSQTSIADYYAVKICIIQVQKLRLVCNGHNCNFYVYYLKIAVN
jgi:hypothetical protein